MTALTGPRGADHGSAGARLRSLLQRDRLVVAPGACDAFTALILEDMGFPAIYLGGNAMGIHLGVGQPLVTMTEAVDCTLRASRAVTCPLVVDANAGFGDPAHTHRTVREFERAGAAAIHIDDQPAPKRAHYHLGRGRVTPVDEMVEKLQIAIHARTDPDFVLIGKTDALRLESLTDTLKRCEPLVATGIDMLLVVDLSPEDAPTVRSEFPDTPLVWIGGHRGPVPTTRQLEDGGFSLAVYPFTTLAAVVQGMQTAWLHLLEEGWPGQSEELLSQMRAHVLDLVGMPTYWRIEQETTERVDDQA
jgi:2-methylisocitrate lyase-like PEP mutase family enzyme